VIIQLFKQDQVFDNSKLVDADNYARTDDLGWVQVEISKSGKLLFKKSNGQTCQVFISEQELSENVNYLGKKQCINL